MSPDPPERKERSYLRRLSAGAYQGIAQVHWSLTIADRKRGWLDAEFHFRFRELLAHTTSRYGLCCPIYCLMPDHLHLLLFGWRDESDQRVAMKFLRKHLNALLAYRSGSRQTSDDSTNRHFQLQKQAYDHVLRKEEASPDAISDVATYIRDNPVRAGLCQTSQDYLFAGCLVPGYPELDIDTDDFWVRFWRVYRHLRESE